MKNFIIIRFLLLAFAVGLPNSACKHLKKVQKSKTTASAVGLHRNEVKTEASTVDGSLAALAISLKEKHETKNVTVTETTGITKTGAFTVTAKFKIDPSAGDDTIRLVDTEDERSRVEIFYDKKTGEGMARIENKEQAVKVPFRQVSITNATINKDVDSHAFRQNAITQNTKMNSASVTSLKKEETKKEIQKEITQSKTPAWVLWPVIIAVVVIIFIIIKRLI